MTAVSRGMKFDKVHVIFVFIENERCIVDCHKVIDDMYRDKTKLLCGETLHCE